MQGSDVPVLARRDDHVLGDGDHGVDRVGMTRELVAVITELVPVEHVERAATATGHQLAAGLDAAQASHLSVVDLNNEALCRVRIG